MRVSAVIAVYNGADRLGEAIDSILAQDHAPCEIIVVDDGSTDTTPDVIRSYGDAVRTIRQSNAGLSAAHNRAVKEVAGEAIAFLDHDDVWPVRRLSSMVRLMQADDGIDIVAGQMKIQFDEESSTILRKQPERLATHYRPWSVQSLLIRPRVFDRVGPFDTTLKSGMDADWYMRARDQGIRYEFLPEISLVCRYHGTNMTRDVDAAFGGMLGALKNSLDRRRRPT